MTERRGTPRTEVREVVRAVVAVLAELRENQVLARIHRKRLACAILDVRSVLDAAGENAESESARSLTSDLLEMRHPTVQRPRRPTSTEDLAWSVYLHNHRKGNR